MKLSTLISYLNFYYDNELEFIFSNDVNVHTAKNQYQQELIAKYQNLLNKESSKPLQKKAVSNNDYNTQNIIKIEKNDDNIKIYPSSSAMTNYALNEIIARATDLASQANSIPQLQQIVNDFDGCSLKKMATNTVFADGNNKAKIMVIGEAPGNNEDLQGIPFCGDSGKLLDEIFASINLTRKDNLYITNTIFWRPPGNRQPTSEELAICRPFLERHIALFNPQLIILVGATALNNILGNDKKISDYRGKFCQFDFAPLNRKINSFTIFHPSYLLRQSSKKKVAWLDMLELEKFIKSNIKINESK